MNLLLGSLRALLRWLFDQRAHRYILRYWGGRTRSLRTAELSRTFGGCFGGNRTFVGLYQILLEYGLYEFGSRWMIGRRGMMPLGHTLLIEDLSLIVEIIRLRFLRYRLNRKKILIQLLVYGLIVADCKASSSIDQKFLWWNCLGCKGQFWFKSGLLEWWTFWWIQEVICS